MRKGVPTGTNGQICSGIVAKPEIIHGLNDKVITSIVKKCLMLNTPDDIHANCDASSYKQAVRIYEILETVLETQKNETDQSYDYLEMDD